MIEISREISIDEGEIHLDYIRASGPGGQNVNKVSSSVQLRFDVKNSPSLPEEIRERLLKIAEEARTDLGDSLTNRQGKNRRRCQTSTRALCAHSWARGSVGFGV